MTIRQTALTKRTVDEEGNESGQELHFFYDSQSKPAFVEFEGERYRYVHSLQGDIIAIVDSAGNTVVEYKYDAWGNTKNLTVVLSTSVGELNPFRFREYVYDEECDLYYLRSRYYSCRLNRFLNADTMVSGAGIFANVYYYCNNSIRYIDSDGCQSAPITPSPSRPDNWYEEFEWSRYFTAAGAFYYGEPNSYKAWQTPKGEWYERWYGDDGTPVMDRHWTDHGNPKEHPHIPHDEDWKDNGKGGKTLDRKSSRPSPKGVKKPTKETTNNKFSFGETGANREVGRAVVIFIIGAVIFLATGNPSGVLVNG